MGLVEQLLKEPESSHLDFKQIWHVSKAKLIQDILSLANARLNQRGHRYIVFGIEDGSRKPITLADTKYRRNTATVYDLLKHKTNRIPQLQVVTENIGGAEIDVIIIEDRPDKPYYMNQDLTDAGHTVRAGVVYERVGDTNTIITDQSLEWMIRERMGLTLEPVDRVKLLMSDAMAWKKRTDSKGHEFYFHNLHPEIRIVEASERERDDLTFSFANFPDPKISRSSFFVNYYGTELYEILVLWLDGGRLSLVQPRVWVRSEKSESQYIESWYHLTGSFGALFQSILDENHHQSSFDYIAEVVGSYESDAAAEKVLSKAWAQRTPGYTFYRITADAIYRINGDKELKRSRKDD